MFAKLAVISALVLAVVAGDSQCNTGSLHCCNSVQSAQSATAAGLLGALGLNVQSITGQVGLTCSPLTAVGLAGNSCSAQPTCCTGNNFNGVVVIGCTPINVNA